jgi:hypothetical protein
LKTDGSGEKHGLMKKDAVLSLACPEDKLKIPAGKLDDADGGREPSRLKSRA